MLAENVHEAGRKKFPARPWNTLQRRTVGNKGTSQQPDMHIARPNVIVARLSENESGTLFNSDRQSWPRKT